MDITEMFQNSEQSLFLENLERLANASREASDDEILRIISGSAAITDDSYYSRPVEILLILLYSGLAIIGFVLNMFMSCVILFSKKLMRNPSNLLVLNLMTSDLLMDIFCVPFTLMSLIWKSWIFGRAMCKLIPFLQSVSIIVCSATIAMIAIDRLIRVTKNISTNSYHSMFARTHWLMITSETALIWIFAIVVSSPIAFFQLLVTMSVKSSLIFSRCFELWPVGWYKGAYAVTNMMIQFFLPTIILIYTNVMIKRHLEKNLSGLEASVGNKSAARETRVTMSTGSGSSFANDQSVNRRFQSFQSLSFGRLFKCRSQPDTVIRTNVTTESLAAAVQIVEAVSECVMNNNQSSSSSSSPAAVAAGNKRNETISRNRSLLMKEITRNQQVTRTLLTIVVAFTITWLPWNVFNVFLDFDPDNELPVESTYLILAFCYLIAMTTIPVNALIYGWANPAIRAEALTLLGLIKRTIADTEAPAAAAAATTAATTQPQTAVINEGSEDETLAVKLTVRSASA